MSSSGLCTKSMATAATFFLHGASVSLPDPLKISSTKPGRQPSQLIPSRVRRRRPPRRHSRRRVAQHEGDDVGVPTGRPPAASSASGKEAFSCLRAEPSDFQLSRYFICAKLRRCSSASAAAPPRRSAYASICKLARLRGSTMRRTLAAYSSCVTYVPHGPARRLSPKRSEKVAQPRQVWPVDHDGLVELARLRR